MMNSERLLDSPGLFLTKEFQTIFKSLPVSNCNAYLGVNTLLKKSIIIIMTNIQKNTQDGYRTPLKCT